MACEGHSLLSGASAFDMSRFAQLGRDRASSERERAAEDLAHDLVAAAADRAKASVARRALDPVLAHVARAAVDLQALVHQLERRALGDQLGHRHLRDRLLAL